MALACVKEAAVHHAAMTMSVSAQVYLEQPDHNTACRRVPRPYLTSGVVSDGYVYVALACL